MLRLSIRLLKYLSVLVLLLGLVYVALIIFVRPSLNRDWTPDQQVLAHTAFDGNKVAITNIRNINYRSTTDYDVHYYDKTFDLDKLESVWFMVEPFSGNGFGAAHTLLSFGFEGGSVCSDIGRNQKGEGRVIRGCQRAVAAV